MADYSIDEATRILGIYRTLFPNTHGALAAYWDYERLRNWSLLTTDFHSCDLPAILAFDTAVRQFETEVRRYYSPSELISSIAVQTTVARRYRELVMARRTGYSLGISPITDDLLLRTFSEQTTRIVILLGHDWYPIVTTSPDGRNLFLPIPPLRRYSILSEKSYEPAVSPLINARDCAIVFLNLYPDFRGLGINKLGSLGDYSPWVKGFIAVCESIATRFELAGVISWGTPVWTAMRKRLDTPFRDLGIMAAVEEQSKLRTPLSLPLGAVTAPYFPFAHPSFGTNFKKKSHWAAYQDVCSRLMGGIDDNLALGANNEEQALERPRNNTRVTVAELSGEKCFICGADRVGLVNTQFEDEDGKLTKVKVCMVCWETLWRDLLKSKDVKIT